MENKQELKLFERVIKTLKAGYGYPCVKNEKDWEKDCIGCQAQKAIDFLKKHIDLIKWDLKNK
ncbi:MAG: hypothetical protein AABY22_31935 [Nanoarchaeota archaeon]